MDSDAQTAVKHKRSEQAGFSYEQEMAPIEKPEVLAPEALAVLAQEKEVASCLESNELAANQLPASWFVASRIHLGGPGEVDYVVLPDLTSRSGCFLGANTGQFWIVRKTAEGYVLVLSLYSHSLDVLPSRSNGLRDIEAYTIALRRNTKTLFKFDGRQYRKRVERTRPSG